MTASDSKLMWKRESIFNTKLGSQMSEPFKPLYGVGSLATHFPAGRSDNSITVLIGERIFV